MIQHGNPALAAWEAFYVITGSSAAALTGLQFVVITLVAERRRASQLEISAFATPTVMHFAAALLIAAVMSAPWPSLASAGLLVGGCGIAGVVFAIRALMRARRQTGYTPVFEDWLWHFLFPILAYGSLVGAAVAIRGEPVGALFVIGAVSAMLLFIGIHNSWDTVTYILTNPPTDEPAATAGSSSAASQPNE